MSNTDFEEFLATDTGKKLFKTFRDLLKTALEKLEELERKRYHDQQDQNNK
jgi:predicted DNA-binding WGR domain protein